jgi:two-component system chemotaxis response regulator CheY
MQPSPVILTVDDSATIRRMLDCTLSGAGYTVVQADDGEAGLEALDRQTPDIIITDINMPRLDGFGFLERVRQQARFRWTPVLVLTTETDAERRARAKALGATGWIVKPFDPRKLLDAIRRVGG